MHLINDFQPNLAGFLANVTLTNCPHALLIKGDHGCGKHLFVQELSRVLALPCRNFTEDVIEDTLDASFKAATERTPAIYLIEADKLSIKDQSALLRTVENPIKSVYFVIIVTGYILPTIANRCYTLEFREYSIHDLRTLYPNVSDPLLQACRTPGRVELYKGIELESYIKLLDNMFANFSRANLSNILTIPNKFAWGRASSSDMDFDLFLLLLRERVANTAKTNSTCLPLYKDILNLVEKCSVAHVDKKRLFESFLLSAKEANYSWS